MRIYFRTNPDTVAFRTIDGATMVPRVGDCVQANGFRWRVTDVVWDVEIEHPVQVDVYLELKRTRYDG